MENRKLSLGMIVRKMNREMFRALRKRFCELADTKLTLEQFGLLYAISNNEGDVVQQDMATFLGKDKSSVLRLIDSLEEKGLIQRIIDSQDRRKKCLFVTDEGTKVIKQYLEIEFALSDELRKGITESEMATFSKVVRVIQENAMEL
jgi:DNA-binding MarR family transcriptional regulator